MSDQSESSHALPLRKPPDLDDDKFRAALPELWRWFDTVFPRQEQPGRAALMLALIRRLSQKHLLLLPKPRNPAYPPLTEQQERERVEFHKLLVTGPWQHVEAEISDLLDWLTPPITDQQREAGKVSFSAQLRDIGLSDKGIAEILKIVSRKRRGRPPERLVSLRAWDLQLLGYKWKEIPDKVCPCTKGAHDESCEQSIRQGVIRLQRIAERYEVTAYAENGAKQSKRNSKRRANSAQP